MIPNQDFNQLTFYVSTMINDYVASLLKAFGGLVRSSIL
jgi:hypothetical protein